MAQLFNKDQTTLFNSPAPLVAGLSGNLGLNPSLILHSNIGLQATRSRGKVNYFEFLKI